MQATGRDKREWAKLEMRRLSRVYPIQDDIPIMLLDAATVDPA